MTAAKTLVICKSVHHHSTARVAERIADVLGAEVVPPEEMPYTRLDEYDLVGFGSGVYYGQFHEALWTWVRGLPENTMAQKPAFVFSTLGLSSLWKLWHRPFTRALARKGFDLIGEFHCPGFDSWGPLGLAGGINRQHPDEHDLARADEFAHGIQAAITARLNSAGMAGQATLRAW